MNSIYKHQPPSAIATDWSLAFDDWWKKNRIATHQIKGSEGFARKVWKAATAYVCNATDNTMSFYQANGGSIPPKKTNHSKTNSEFIGVLETLLRALENEQYINRLVDVRIDATDNAVLLGQQYLGLLNKQCISNQK